LLFRVVGDVLSSDDQTAGVRLEESHNVVQRHRFAYPAAAQDANRFRRKDLEGHVIEYYVVPKSLGYIEERDIRVGFGFFGHRC
jgi:hypothetical protein